VWRHFRRLGVDQQIGAVVVGGSIGLNAAGLVTIGDPSYPVISRLGTIALALQFGLVFLLGMRMFVRERRSLKEDIRDLEDEWRQMAARLRVVSGQEYMVSETHSAILCLTCGMVSRNPNDVSNKFCGNCHKFLDVRSVN
jgi:hypothetical protein